MSATLSQGVAVHCRAGIGRTGTLLACYLVKFKQLKPEEAILHVRTARPHSIETVEQEKTVADYFKFLYLEQACWTQTNETLTLYYATNIFFCRMWNVLGGGRRRLKLSSLKSVPLYDAF